MSLLLLAKTSQIMLLNIVLSADNAVVIAMAAHKLPVDQRRTAILWGGAIAILLRIAFTLIMTYLLMVPGLRLLGGVLLIWIACKLLWEEDEDESDAVEHGHRTTFSAIRMIFLADLAMSLDNMLAVAGAAGEESSGLLMFGLLASICIIMFCSSLIARLMNRFKFIAYLSVAILAYTGAEMMMGDREFAWYVANTYQVSLDGHWERDFMLTEGEISSFADGREIPESLQDVVRRTGPYVQFVGQMNSAQRDLLLSGVTAEADRRAIQTMYETSRHQEIPDWLPGFLKHHAEPWFQHRWPTELCFAVEGRQIHFVSWLWHGSVILFCMMTPLWRRSRVETSDDKVIQKSVVAPSTGVEFVSGMVVAGSASGKPEG